MAKNSLLAEGAQAPEFSLFDDASGEKISLAGLRGEPVVLFFYPKDNTPGCTTEACDFRDNLERFRGRGAHVLGISPDSLASHERFRTKQALTFPLLSDEGHEVASAYGVWREKKSFGKTYDGIVRTTVLIDVDGKIARLWDSVRVKGHVDAVFAALEELTS